MMLKNLLEKRLILSILFVLVFIKPSIANELKDLFGIKIYENTQKYFTNSFIKSNKYKNKETFKGFYDIEVTSKITEKNPFLSKYWIIVDESNVIQQISAEETILDLQKCKDFKEQLISIFNTKYSLKFIKKDFTHKHFYSHFHFTKIDNNKVLYIKCVNNFIKKNINLLISLESRQYLNRKKEYYEAGF